MKLVSPEMCRRVELLSRLHGTRTVAEITGLARGTVQRIAHRGFQPCFHTRPPRQMPTDFAIQTRHMSCDELRRHYRTSNRTIGRWRRELRERA